MSSIDKLLQNLELIPLLFEKVESLEDILKLVQPNLKEGINVQRFLGISRNTLTNYVNSNKLEKGVHYIMNGRKREYIPQAILEFKKNFTKNERGLSESTLLQNELLAKLELKVA